MRKLTENFQIPVFMDMMPCRLIHKVDQEILVILKREVVSSFIVLAPARFVSLRVVPFQTICVKAELDCSYTRRAS
jgi:hypothetical protein